MEKVTTKLEYVLCAYARPIFLAITEPDEDNDIQVVISSLAFKTMNVGERVSYVFGLIRKHLPEILNDRLVIIQAYSPEEIEEVLDKVFLPELDNKE
jgi:hypothetical protein